jgi:hypothetical protein
MRTFHRIEHGPGKTGAQGRPFVFHFAPTLIAVTCAINSKEPGRFRGFVTRPCSARELARRRFTSEHADTHPVLWDRSAVLIIS